VNKIVQCGTKIHDNFFTLGNIKCYSDIFQKHVLNGDEPEQYTGLNNPNGTEIYEGDLLDDGGFGLIEVFWSESDGCTYVKHIGENGHLSGDDLCCYTDRLVCGNIHE